MDTCIYRVETAEGECGERLIRGYYAQPYDAEMAADYYRMNQQVWATVTPINPSDLQERDAICFMLNQTVHAR